ncbi:hypothetical protein DNTS_003841, partial [Danionella cerebrum]
LSTEMLELNLKNAGRRSLICQQHFLQYQFTLEENTKPLLAGGQDGCMAHFSTSSWYPRSRVWLLSANKPAHQLTRIKKLEKRPRGGLWFQRAMAYAAFWASINGDTSFQTQATVPRTSRHQSHRDTIDMGQILSWIRGTRDQAALQDVAVEEQSEQITPTASSQVSTAKPAQYEKGTTPSSTAGGGSSSSTQKTPSQVLPQATDSKVAAASSTKASGSAGTPVGVKPADPAKSQSTSASSSKPGPAKGDPVAEKPSAGAPKQTIAPKVQVEVAPSAPKVITEDLDPIEALSGTLPPSQPVAPKVSFTGPEVKEKIVKEEKGVFTGERDDTLPPGYKKEDLEKKKAGVPEKPQEIPKPISTKDALESLSSTFKTETIGAVDVHSAGSTNFAPPPPSKQKQPVASQPAPVTKSAAPPADKKAKIEVPPQPAKPKPEELDNSMSLDALNDLSETLGAPESPKISPELKPRQIVHEKTEVSAKASRLGEREDTLPPGYRFKEEELKKYPPPVKEPSQNTDEAMDILAEDFATPATVSVVHAPVPPTPEKKKPDVAPAKTKDVPKDAFSALGDTLPAPEPPKKQPDLKLGDIVHEKDVTSKKGVRVGEREDTLPPDFRFTEEELKKYPPPEKQATDPSSDFALDALADDFVQSSSASKVQSAASATPHTDRQLSEGTSSALDALSDTLGEMKPAQEPAPVAPEAIINEKNVVEERVSKAGERDDSLPPDQRFTEKERKAFHAEKQKGIKPKQTSMDDTAALEKLSSDFSAVPVVEPMPSDGKHFTLEHGPPPFKAPLCTEGPVFDALAEKAIPSLTDPKVKPKKPTVEDSQASDLPSKPSTDMPDLLIPRNR